MDKKGASTRVNQEPYDLFIFAGEVSGDLHGEKLLKSLYTLHPNLRISGVGGPRMRALGMQCILPMEDFEVMGFIDILSSLPKFLRLFKIIKKHILDTSPKGVVFIDYPGFNLRMASTLHKNKSQAKRIQYVCPTVWAWGKKRIPKMEKSLDKLLTILPFEPDCFSKEKIDVEYVGHPLISRIEEHSYDSEWRSCYDISQNLPILSLFPGSRQKEVERNLPLQMQAAKNLLKERKDLQIIVSCSDEKFFPLIEHHIDDSIKIIPSAHIYELMRDSHLAIATSGTVTLELALHLVPTVVTYAIDPFDVFLAQKVFRINLPHYSLANILGKKEIFPELFGPLFTEKNLEKKAKEFLLSQFKRNHCVEECRRLQSILGTQNASHEAAKAILKITTLSLK